MSLSPKQKSESLVPHPGEDLLRGTLERIIYFNEENQYCIGELREENSRNTHTIVGTMPSVQCGETLELAGQHGHHPQHGSQFKVREFRSTLPASIYGIRKFLGSGLIPGIGKTYAEKIVDHFGDATLDIISHESARLKEVPGIGKERAKKIKKAWDEQQHLREIMTFLQQYGVTTSQCLRINKQFGMQAKEILQNDPYRIAREINGIGFKTADRIAINYGHANDSANRVDAGLLFTLQELEDEGHTAVSQDDLINHAVDILNVDRANVEARLQVLIENKTIILQKEEGYIQSYSCAQQETAIADRLHLIQTIASALPPIKVDIAVQWAQDRAGFEFAPEQAMAVRAALENKVSIITGGPGTGKTTILRAVVDILKAKKVRITLASPTGRAAKRMTEAAGAFAQTIHRLLKYDPAEQRFSANEYSPLSTEFVIVDEASMLDVRLASSLLKAIPNAAHVLLVGDINQLPSVGSGNVLADLIQTELFSVSRLQRIFRQGKDSSIVGTAHNILSGNAFLPPTVESVTHLKAYEDVQFVKALNPEECVDKVVRIATRFLPENFNYDPVMDCQILAPMHKGVGGIGNLNLSLQKAFNERSKGFKSGNQLFSEGDKVIQMRNNYDKNVFNGDLGRITHINPEAHSLTVDFDGNSVDYERGELGDLTLAYATSVHKSQGSEFPVVIIPVLTQHFMMLRRNLIYTAVTRGKKKVYLVGDPKAYAMAVRNAESSARITDLKRKIIRKFQG